MLKKNHFIVGIENSSKYCQKRQIYGKLPVLIESIKCGENILTYDNKLILQMFSIKIKKPQTDRKYTKRHIVKNAERKTVTVKELVI